jgi:putative ABC transport system substrate-binding protein
VEHHKTIGELANRYGLPTVAAFRVFPADGGLASYGVYVPTCFGRRRAMSIGYSRVSNPPTFPWSSRRYSELAINLKTAKALGLDVPPTLLARAEAQTWRKCRFEEKPQGVIINSDTGQPASFNDTCIE